MRRGRLGSFCARVALDTSAVGRSSSSLDRHESGRDHTAIAEYSHETDVAYSGASCSDLAGPRRRRLRVHHINIESGSRGPSPYGYSGFGTESYIMGLDAMLKRLTEKDKPRR